MRVRKLALGKWGLVNHDTITTAPIVRGRLDEHGQPIHDPESKHFWVQAHAIRVGHILGYEIAGPKFLTCQMKWYDAHGKVIHAVQAENVSTKLPEELWEAAERFKNHEETHEDDAALKAYVITCPEVMSLGY